MSLVANGQAEACLPPLREPRNTPFKSWSITGCPGAGAVSSLPRLSAFNTSNQVNLGWVRGTRLLSTGQVNQLVASSVDLVRLPSRSIHGTAGIQGNGSATEAGIATTLGGTFLRTFNRSGGGIGMWSMNVHGVSSRSSIIPSHSTPPPKPMAKTTYLESCWEGSWFCPGAAWVFTDNITFGIQDALPPRRRF